MCVKASVSFFLSVICASAGLNPLAFHLQHSSLSWAPFSQAGSHMWRFVHFPSCKSDISSSYITHIKWGMWEGPDEEKEDGESPVYHVSIRSRWIIEELVRLTRVARSCACWLFFGRMSLCSPCCTIYLLHCLLGISLSICLSVCLLALACFSLLPPLKQSFLGCCDSHVILACRARQAPAPGLRTPQPRYSLAEIQQACESDKPVMHINIHWHVFKHAWC